MQAIMLAAGKGSRLGKYTKDNTKCMVEINGISLLERAIDSLTKAGINKLILVVGYKKENLKSYIVEKGLNKKIEIIYIDNDDYASTNNIYSLYMASEYFNKEDYTILLESDLIYDESIIEKIVSSPYKNLAVVAKHEDWMDGTVVISDADDNIIEFIEKEDFNYSNVDNYYKTLNIYKFSKEYLEQYYLPFLKTYIEVYGKNDYYELVLKVLSGIPNSGLKAYKIKNEVWYEIDDCQDYEMSSMLFSDDDNRLNLYQKRFGGYWRFASLKDFCYLVNPYFPTDKMFDKMKYNFEKLITAYPSTMSVQNNLISRFFDIDENKLLVGNGAAELINSLNSIIKGSVGIPIPTFNEYVRCLPNNKIINIDLSKNNYTITKDLVLSYIDSVEALVLVNPDNPCGSFLTKEDVIEILDVCKEKNKYLIFDESFIDFVSEDRRYTLLNDAILEKYDKLIVIKSISKSYGVPGLRIGVLASSNQKLLRTIKDNMPVWNVNSFAEYFLQIFIPFKKKYIYSCNKIGEVRKTFISELEKIKFVEVFPSEANYLLIRLKGVNSTHLAKYLLGKYEILIKDLRGKSGFDDQDYIRVAVKSEEDNKEFIKALQKFEGEISE